MTTLDDPHTREFLGAGTRTGKLGFVAADGRPLIAPVWFVVDDGALWFTTGADSAKGRAVARDARVVLCVDLEQPPWDFVQVQGTVTTTTDPERMREVAAAAGARYMGPEHAEGFGERNSTPGTIAVALHPTRILTSFDAA